MKLPRHAELWFPAYAADRLRRRLHRSRPKRLWVAITDHYEPMGGNVDLSQGLARVRTWQERWPSIALRAPRDADGHTPRFTFFYPQEEYRLEILRELEPMVRAGLADVEVHIHHDHDTAHGFETRMRTFLQQLHGTHGLLHRHHGELVFGFIHGNWALDNSRPDGRWCGVTGELQILRRLGCYADFTMPSLPSPTQSRIVNQIYWTTGSPERPRGFDHGVRARPGQGRHGDLLMINGPLGLRFRGRLVPRAETGELAIYDPPTPYRVERWIDLAPRLGDDIFVKLYGHSAREDNAGALLGNGLDGGTLGPMFRWIAEAAQRRRLELHWASAYEMFSAVERILQPAAPDSPEHSVAPRSLPEAGA